MNGDVLQVACPTCGKAVEWTSEQKWRPFCSKRCKLIDLGDWLAEEHRILGEADLSLRDDQSGDDQ